MEQLIYASVATSSVSGCDVFDIIHKSSLRNPQRGITGFLFFTNGLFFQFVEGEPAVLDSLLDDLGRDPRHHSIKVLARGSCEQRSFPGWKMKRIHVSDQISQPVEFGKQLRALGIPAEPVHEVEQYLAARAA